MSESQGIIRKSDCRIILMSPEPWQECIVDVETQRERVFVLSDEASDGNCIIKLPGTDESIVRRMYLSELRDLLNAAENKLLDGKSS